jgi:DNA-binding HxlR family transcriptional regulator
LHDASAFAYCGAVLGRSYEGQNCPAARALEVVGERWSLLIIRDALSGMTRFTDFQRSLGLAPNILAARLEHFVRAGLMAQRPQTDHPGLPEYVLTEKGRDLAPVLIALAAWGNRWAAPDGRKSSTVMTAAAGRLLPSLPATAAAGWSTTGES